MRVSSAIDILENCSVRAGVRLHPLTSLQGASTTPRLSSVHVRQDSGARWLLLLLL